MSQEKTAIQVLYDTGKVYQREIYFLQEPLYKNLNQRIVIGATPYHLLAFQFNKTSDDDWILRLDLLGYSLTIVHPLSLEPIHKQLIDIKYDPATKDAKPVLKILGFTNIIETLKNE